jgi:hypothetical protein
MVSIVVVVLPGAGIVIEGLVAVVPIVCALPAFANEGDAPYPYVICILVGAVVALDVTTDIFSVKAEFGKVCPPPRVILYWM